MKKLLIISHTHHYKNENGELVGWGPTIRELNSLSSYFKKIYHIGTLHEDPAPESALKYNSDSIEFIGVRPFGGKGILDKFNVLKAGLSYIEKINSIIDQVDIIQIRVPMGAANFLLPWFWIKNKYQKLVWVKYAGNWNQENAPLGYRFQKWFLKKNFLSIKVTINGQWPGQPKHCISFENPCLSDSELTEGKHTLNDKSYSGPYKAVFVGRLEDAKGVRRILGSFKMLKKLNIISVDFIGTGAHNNEYKKEAENLDFDFIFHGSVSRNEIPRILKQSHFLFLPSTASEGFPKVIAEGWNYGCIPIVSNVSGIPYYVNSENGFLWDTKEKKFDEFLDNLSFTQKSLVDKANIGYKTAQKFSFTAYYKKIESLILT